MQNTPDTNDLIDTALHLPLQQRVALASALLMSIDPTTDPLVSQSEVDAAWDEEIGRRIEEIENGRIETVSSADVWEFKLELQRAEARVTQSPASWARYFHNTRGFRFLGFPFVLVYVVRDERIFVISLAHTRRKPGYWRERLS